MNQSQADTLKVPDATLRYDVCGSGPARCSSRAALRTPAVSRRSGTCSPTGTPW